MDWFFGDGLEPLDRVVRRAQLARLLRFYVDRAGRHRLSEQALTRLNAEIDQMVLKENAQPGMIDSPDVGYVFCPEHRSGQVERIYPERSDTALWLFGPMMLPEEISGAAGTIVMQNDLMSAEIDPTGSEYNPSDEILARDEVAQPEGEKPDAENARRLQPEGVRSAGAK